MRIGSLFSGIGGLERGLELAGVGHTVFQVERESYCQDVLRRHWPGVALYDDVCKVGSSNLPPADLLCGGFPCQDVSGAGAGAGLAGARSGLWYEYLRIVEETRPAYVIVENVASGAKRWLPHVRRDLHLRGYRTRAFALSAFDVGAPHLRKRIFVLATDPYRVQLRDEQRWSSRANGERKGLATDLSEARSFTDSDRVRELQSQGSQPHFWRWLSNGSGWQVEPPICGVDDGPTGHVDRAQRLKTLGNAVVPQCAEVIGRVLLGETILSN